MKLFKDNRYVWLHCIDLESRFELTVKSFPLLKIKLVYGHFSSMWDLWEPRLVMFPDLDDVMSKLTGVKSPCCIEAKSSTVFDEYFFLCKGLRPISLCFYPFAGYIGFHPMSVSPLSAA